MEYQEKPAILGARIAAWLGAGLLLGMAIVVVFAWNDRARLADLEHFSETTAVGDRIYFPLPDPLPTPPAIIARFRDESFVPVDYNKVEIRDTKMQPAGRDPGSKLTIYKLRDPAGGGDFFVKTASNEYLRLRRAAE
jgi:hypothetical protein